MIDITNREHKPYLNEITEFINNNAVYHDALKIIHIRRYGNKK